MLVVHEGRLVPIKEPINLAERRPTPYLHEVIDLTDDSDDLMPDTLGSLEELVRDFTGGEEEQA